MGQEEGTKGEHLNILLEPSLQEDEVNFGELSDTWNSRLITLVTFSF